MDKLVVYFSASNHTKDLAISLAKHIKADAFEIVPKVKYTSLDLDWNNPNSRSSLEMKNLKARPEFIDKPLDLSKYDTIYLGFPIWWYTAPRIINTFLEKHDFNNKKIVLFATSGSSNFENTKKDLLMSLPSSCKIVEGKVNPKDFKWL